MLYKTSLSYSYERFNKLRNYEENSELVLELIDCILVNMKQFIILNKYVFRQNSGF